MVGDSLPRPPRRSFGYCTGRPWPARSRNCSASADDATWPWTWWRKPNCAQPG